MKLSVCLVLCIVSGVLSQTDYETKRAFPRDCDSGYSMTCLKLDIVSFIDKLAETKEYNVLSGVSVVREFGNLNDTKNAEIVAGM